MVYGNPFEKVHFLTSIDLISETETHYGQIL